MYSRLLSKIKIDYSKQIKFNKEKGLNQLKKYKNKTLIFNCRCDKVDCDKITQSPAILVDEKMLDRFFICNSIDISFNCRHCNRIINSFFDWEIESFEVIS